MSYSCLWGIRKDLTAVKINVYKTNETVRTIGNRLYLKYGEEKNYKEFEKKILGSKNFEDKILFYFLTSNIFQIKDQVLLSKIITTMKTKDVLEGNINNILKMASDVFKLSENHFEYFVITNDHFDIECKCFLTKDNKMNYKEYSNNFRDNANSFIEIQDDRSILTFPANLKINKFEITRNDGFSDEEGEIKDLLDLAELKFHNMRKEISDYEYDEFLRSIQNAKSILMRKIVRRDHPDGWN